MNIAGDIVVFIVVWWLALFTLLPIGIKTPEEAGEEREPGTHESAPVKPAIGKKMILATIIATMLWVAYKLIVKYKLITLGE